MLWLCFVQGCGNDPVPGAGRWGVRVGVGHRVVRAGELGGIQRVLRVLVEVLALVAADGRLVQRDVLTHHLVVLEVRLVHLEVVNLIQSRCSRSKVVPFWTFLFVSFAATEHKTDLDFFFVSA